MLMSGWGPSLKSLESLASASGFALPDSASHLQDPRDHTRVPLAEFPLLYEVWIPSSGGQDRFMLGVHRQGSLPFIVLERLKSLPCSVPTFTCSS